jgi:uncharacterized heparinase superfamily protein
VRDRLDGAGDHGLVWRFHLDPDLAASIDGDRVRLAGADRELWLALLARPAGLGLRLERGWVSASYGVRRETTVVVAERAGALPVEAVWACADRVPGPAEIAAWLDALERLG